MTKTRLILTFILFVSLVCIFVIKYIWGQTPEKWDFGEETGEVLFGLCISYIAAFIFYVIDIWIPQNQEKKKRYNRLAVPLSRLLNHMKSQLIGLTNSKTKEELNFNDFEKEVFIENVESYDLINDIASLYFTDLDRNATYGEYLDHHISRVNEYIEEIYKLPINLEIEFIEILDDIKKSTYHEIMESMKRLGGFDGSAMVKGQKIGMQGDAISEPLYLYYENYLRLKKYMNINRITLTIEDL